MCDQNLKLDIGCGAEKRAIHDEFIGIDIRDYGWNVVRDIKRGLPYCDNSVIEIHCHNTMEHIEQKETIWVMNEFWRVLKPEGKIDLLVPFFTGNSAIIDPSHLSFWSKGQMAYYRGRRPRNSDIGIKHWQNMSYDEKYKDSDDVFRIFMQPNK